MTTDTPAATEPDQTQPSRSSTSLGDVLIGILHIAGLSAIAVAQPLFDLLGQNAEFFVARESRPIDIWLMTLALILVIPLAALLIELGARLIGDGVYRVVHVVFIGGLAGAIALQLLSRFLSINGWIVLAIAALLAIAAGIAYDRFATVRSFLTWLSPAPLAVATLFLLFTPVNRLVFPTAVAGDAASIGSSDTPVVLIVWDELNSIGLAGPDGAIDRDSYPNFGRLADDGTWYRRASGVSDSTSFAVPAILDGMFPDPALLPITADHPHNLFSLLSESHEIVAREPVTAVCAPSICEDTTPASARPGLVERMTSLASDLRVVYLHVLLPEDLRGGLPAIDRVWGDFGATADDHEGDAPPVTAEDTEALREEFSDRRANAYIRDELSTDRVASVGGFIDGLPTVTDRPPFVFLHAALPHAPYRYSPSGRQYGSSGQLLGLDDGRWVGEDWAIAQGEQRYLMQTQVTDGLLGDLLAWLDAEGIYDDALIIVTSDHGVGFSPGDFVRSATPENFGETMSVPMVVKLPGGSDGVISDDDVRTIDIVPTILDVLGAETDWKFDGRSMLLEPIDRGPKTQMRTDGLVVESDPSMPAWDAALANKVGRFGTAEGAIDVYRPGMTPIVGMQAAALTAVGESVGSAQVNALQAIQNVDFSLGLSPSHITGRILLDEPIPGDFAVAINGVVQIVGPPIEPDSLGGTFSYFVPEEAFRDGANTVAIFLVRGAPDDPQLVPIDLLGGSVYSTSIYADGNEYLESDGVGVPINDHLTGRVDVVVLNGAIYSIGGWAADTHVGRPADEIVLVIDGVSVLVSAPNVTRPDVAKALGDPAYEDSGYGLEVAADLVDRAESIRVFGVMRGVAATELSLPEGAFGR